MNESELRYRIIGILLSDQEFRLLASDLYPKLLLTGLKWSNFEISFNKLYMYHDN